MNFSMLQSNKLQPFPCCPLGDFPPSVSGSACLTMAEVLQRSRSTHIDANCCWNGFLAKDELVKQQHLCPWRGTQCQDEPVDDIPPFRFLFASLCGDITEENLVVHGDQHLSPLLLRNISKLQQTSCFSGGRSE